MYATGTLLSSVLRLPLTSPFFPYTTLFRSHQVSDGRWRADWPDHEGYDVGPPSIAWLTWHIGFWWSMAIDHSFGDGSLSRENVLWPGKAAGVREWRGRLQWRWQGVLGQVCD